MIMAAAASMHFFFLHPAVRVVIVLNAIVQSFLVAASRNHYTVDVIVAIIVALLAYVAFTRHPSLVALTTFVPAKVRLLLLRRTSRASLCAAQTMPVFVTPHAGPVQAVDTDLWRGETAAAGAQQLLPV